MQCPHCGVKGSVDDSYEGKKMRCPKCTGIFIAEKEQALAEDIPQEFADQNLKQTVNQVQTSPEQDVQEEENDDLLNEEDIPAEIVQESISVDESEKVDETEMVEESTVSDDQDDTTELMMEKDTLADNESVEEISLEESADFNPPLVSSATDEPIEDLDSFEAEQAQKNLTEPHACGRCGKVAAGREEYLELEGKFFCPLCAPEVEDELLTSAQAAGAVAGNVGALNTGLSSVADLTTSDDWENFTVGEALSRSWRLTSGVKLPIWGGVLVTTLAMLVIIAGITLVTLATSPDVAGVVGMVGQIAYYIVSTVLTAGLMYMGVKRAARRQVGWKDVFSGFNVAVKITIAMILQTILITLGMFLLILPGIYLMVGYMMTLPLIIDQNMPPWQAMETSRKAIHKVWWKISGLYLVISLIVMVSTIPAGIGLIWTVPMSMVLVGVVYRYLFGKQKIAD